MQATATQHNACTTLSIRLASVSAKHASLKMNQAQTTEIFKARQMSISGKSCSAGFKKKLFFQHVLKSITGTEST